MSLSPKRPSTSMLVRDVLALPSLREARVVAGHAGLEHAVRWAHVVDLPEPSPWVERDQLLLTSGVSWPRDDAVEERQVNDLAAQGLAAIGLAVPGYVEHFSEGARAAAERNGLPLIEIPWDVPFVQITQELHQTILRAQQSALERSAEIHRALTQAAADGTSLADLARRLGSLIERSVTFEDPGGKLLAHHVAGSDVDPVRAQTLEGDQSPSGVLAALQQLGHLERIRSSTIPVRIPAIDEIGLTARVVCPIRIGDELAGFVWIIEGATELSDLDHRAAEHAALVAAVQIARARELAQLESRLGYAAFMSLLEAPDATPQTLERARLLGFDTDAAYRVGIAIVDEPLPLGREGVLRRDSLTDRLRRQLAHAGVARPMLGASLNWIAFLLPEGIAPARVLAALEGEGVRVVLGRPYTGTDGVRTSYREARSITGQSRGPGTTRYEDVLIPRVLSGDPEAGTALLAQLLGPLENVRGGEGLRLALLGYADEGFQFRRTAVRLGIHPNTLRYRLERIREVTGLVLDDADVRFKLQLASRLIAAREAYAAAHHR